MQFHKRSTIAGFLAVLLLASFVLTSALAQQSDTTHLVSTGETAESIAIEYNITVDALLEANALTNPAQVTPGTILLIPTQSDDESGSENARSTSTPRASTAGQSSADNERVLEAFPTDIPPTLTPTPLPYDESRVVDLIEPDESRRFTVGVEPVDIRGVVQFDPETMSFWKLEIRGNGRRSTIGSDPMTTKPAFEWITLSTHTNTIIDGHLGSIPGYPTLSLGNWEMRVVAVNNDGTFAGIEQVPFRVSIADLPPIPVAIDTPVEGGIMQPGQPINGSIELNWATTAYRVELLGGNYSSWSEIANITNPVDDPIRINNGTLATLPNDLIDGRYRLRLVISGPDGNDIQAPIVRNFAIGTDETSNLPEIFIDEPRNMQNGNLVVREDTQIIGDVNVPDPNGYFKLEIRDAERLEENQEPRFFDWTTIGSPTYSSIEDTVLGTVAGPPAIAPGRYSLRIVIVNSESEFSDVRVFDLRVRAP